MMRYSGNGSVTGEELFRLEREQKNNNDDDGKSNGVHAVSPSHKTD